MPPYEIRKVGNAKIAFVGLTFEGTPTVVTPSGVVGLESGPRWPPSTSLVDKLRNEQGVKRSWCSCTRAAPSRCPPRCSPARRTNRTRTPHIVDGTRVLWRHPDRQGRVLPRRREQLHGRRGDNYTVFRACTDPLGGAVDLDAFAAYLAANPGLAPPALTRIEKVG